MAECLKVNKFELRKLDIVIVFLVISMNLKLVEKYSVENSIVQKCSEVAQ